MFTRYATKKFDTSKTVSNNDLNKIIDLMVKSPSAVNIQPWEFYILESKEAKEKAAETAFGMNISKIVDASHVIMFVAKNKIDENFLNKLTDKEEEDGRYENQEFKTASDSHRKEFVLNIKDQKSWIDNQVYISLGYIIGHLEQMEIDSVAIAGFSRGKLDDAFNLAEKGLHSVMLLSIGYRAEDDFNAKIPKSRFDAKELIKKL